MHDNGLIKIKIKYWIHKVATTFMISDVWNNWIKNIIMIMWGHLQQSEYHVAFWGFCHILKIMQRSEFWGSCCILRTIQRSKDHATINIYTNIHSTGGSSRGPRVLQRQRDIFYCISRVKYSYGQYIKQNMKGFGKFLNCPPRKGYSSTCVPSRHNFFLSWKTPM